MFRGWLTSHPSGTHPRKALLKITHEPRGKTIFIAVNKQLYFRSCLYIQFFYIGLHIYILHTYFNSRIFVHIRSSPKVPECSYIVFRHIWHSDLRYLVRSLQRSWSVCDFSSNSLCAKRNSQNIANAELF